MKTLDDIRKAPGMVVDVTVADGGRCFIYGADPKKPNRCMCVVFSTGGGWDHVSVSWPNRCPTWDEMCMVKRIFFDPEDTVIEYHPAESEYVNLHPYCLHMWRPRFTKIPTPPSWMVGAKKGESIMEAMAKAEEMLNEEDDGK